MNPLNAYLAQEIINDYASRAERYRLADAARKEDSLPRYDAVTIRRTTPDDWTSLERLADLEGRPAPSGAALVAEVDERILAARWIGDDVTLADPFLPTAELVSLLDARARHLGARPRFLPHPLRRAAAALRRGPATLRH
jgi:hypothetical protein